MQTKFCIYITFIVFKGFSHLFQMHLFKDVWSEKGCGRRVGDSKRRHTNVSLWSLVKLSTSGLRKKEGFCLCEDFIVKSLLLNFFHSATSWLKIGLA